MSGCGIDVEESTLEWLNARFVEVFPSLAKYADDKLRRETPQNPTSRANQEQSSALSPEECFPHLHALLHYHGFNFFEAYSRKETRQILGISDKTLGRWIDQGSITIYGQPDVCVSAKDIEECIVRKRRRSGPTVQGTECV